jgi:NitT/TauT family transport system permease protein
MSQIDASPRMIGLATPRRRRALLPQSSAMTKLLGALIAFALILVLWFVLSAHLHPWVPSPVATVEAAWKVLGTPELYRDLVATAERLVTAFVASTLIGTVIGIAVGLDKRVEAFFQPLLALMLAVPDPVYIIFAILGLGTGEVTGIVALSLVVTPFVANIVRSSVQARDTTLDEMAKVYRISRWRTFTSTLLPQLVPALITAGRFSFALSWKVVILVEALAQPTGIGARVYHDFSMFRMAPAFAVAIMFCVVMQIVERLVLQQLEQRALRWRS